MPMDISWAFNGVPIDAMKDKEGIKVTRITKHLSTLSIDGVSAGHAGEYACSASNLAGSVSRSTTLTVNVAPQILQFSFGDDPLNSGEMLSVSCTIVKGDFPLNLTWTFNDVAIDPTQPDINVVFNKRVSFLSIDSVAARHAGRYKCTATNAAGSDSHTAVLSVNGTRDPHLPFILILNN
ncbi:cell adhesion molecule Dscam1-like [Prorops nasuta]|uniref:cell adhesion molecule Dscam1-like n=1 Tax=Prorops nasuta TaxID=863751 RepID=UPI0034CDD722